MPTDIFGMSIANGDYILTPDGTGYHLKRIIKIYGRQFPHGVIRYMRVQVEWYSRSGKRYTKTFYQDAIIKVNEADLENLDGTGRVYLWNKEFGN